MTTMEENTNLVKKEQDLPSLPDEMLSDDVLGYSEDNKDSMIPILSIIQDQSAEVKKKHERYIEGVEAGDLIIRSMQRTFNGEEGIIFQPCGFEHVWVEWSGEPGEGAPVMQYPFDERPVEAKEVARSDGGSEWRLPNGNRLVDTRYHYGNIVIDGGFIPVVIPMAGTNHTVSRQWTTLMKQHRYKGKRAPAFLRTYKITTAYTQRGQQSWYRYKIVNDDWVKDEVLLREGFNFAKSVTSRNVQVDLSSDVTETVSDTNEQLNEDEIPF